MPTINVELKHLSFEKVFMKNNFRNLITSQLQRSVAIYKKLNVKKLHSMPKA